MKLQKEGTLIGGGAIRESINPGPKITPLLLQFSSQSALDYQIIVKANNAIRLTNASK